MTYDPSAAFAPFAVWRDNLPVWMSRTGAAGITLADWIGLAGLVVAAVLVGGIGQWLLLRVARAVIGRTKTGWDDRLIALLPGPLAVLIGIFAFSMAVPHLGLEDAAADGVSVAVRVLLVATCTVLASRLVGFAAGMLTAYLARRVSDESRREAIRTQVALPSGILRTVVITVGVALVLLQFEVVRNVGVSLLASAGVAGIVIGLAAQKTVGNLIAGIQLAVVQPIRVGDAVVVEGEWGWVEEIGLMHVVVKVWDLRRLVLPVAQFLEKPFQNWTRGVSELLGTATVHADYSVPIDAVRAEFAAILKDAPQWDGQVQGVQVTELTERGVQIRLLMSARDGGQLWDLRCHVREKLLGWLQREGHSHLTHQRVELTRAPAAPPPAEAD